MVSSWEKYWIGGYTVTGATDVIVTRYGRTREAAATQALEASTVDVERLTMVGIAADVASWHRRAVRKLP